MVIVGTLLAAGPAIADEDGDGPCAVPCSEVSVRDGSTVGQYRERSDGKDYNDRRCAGHEHMID